MKKRSDEPGYVYFMVMYRPMGDDETNDSSGDDSVWIKIGFSTSPTARLSNLRTAIPFEIEIEETFPGTEAEERALHKRFAKHRIKREWFRFDEEIGEFLDDLRDAEILLKMKHGDDYEPSLSECLAVENPGKTFNDIFCRGDATMLPVEPPSPNEDHQHG